jgi:hypothetical protein
MLISLVTMTQLPLFCLRFTEDGVAAFAVWASGRGRERKSSSTQPGSTQLQPAYQPQHLSLRGYGIDISDQKGKLPAHCFNTRKVAPRYTPAMPSIL